jgi:hypothetical protein
MREHQDVRNRVKSGQASAGLVGAQIKIVCEREFVLASGARQVVRSGGTPTFSIFALPDHFEWIWPMHEFLPNELAPLESKFNVRCTVGMLKEIQVYIIGFQNGDEVYHKSLEESLKKFVKQVPLLRNAVKIGQPEATATWTQGCRSMCMLLYYRWHRNLLPMQKSPFGLVPIELRSYELPRQAGAEPARNAVKSIPDGLEMDLPAIASPIYFILRMPESPFPIPRSQLAAIFDYCIKEFSGK